MDQHIVIRKPRPRVPLVLVTIIGLLAFGLYINHQQKLEKEKEIAIAIPKQKEIAQEQALSPLAQEATLANQTPSLPVPGLVADVVNENTESASKDAEITQEINEMDLTALKKLEQKLQEVAKEPNENKPVTEDISSKPQKIVKEVEVAKAPVEKEPPSHGEAWLKGLEASSYTLQVVATKESSQLEKLIKREKLSNDYAYFPKPVKDSTYYVLVIGNYSSREEAVNSVDDLPKNLQKNKPWPVKLESVQAFLK